MTLPGSFEPLLILAASFIKKDAGGVFDGGFDFDELRSSAGIAMEIPTPISPIVVGYALPLQEKEGDATQKFFFTMSGL